MAEVDTAAMITMSGRCTDYHGYIRQIADNVDLELQSLGWTGEARQAFLRTMGDWYTDFNTILNELNLMSNDLVTSARTYETSHSAAIDSANF